MSSVEDTLHAMQMWAIENDLEKEFTKEILESKRLNTWIVNDGLVKRFGYFVLEHTGFL